jgi:hypothetical protein
MSTTFPTHAQPGRVRTIAARLARHRPITRRDLQVALGVLWLLDGALQVQPFMFTRGFAVQVIAPVGQGQPGVVSGPVHLASVVIAANPLAWNLLAAAIQLLLGIGLLVARTARNTRFALTASIGWALGVWYVGEGLSGLASGHGSLLTGAPGSALLYAIMAGAAWPRRTSEQAPASWLAPAWALLWVGGALLQLLPGQNSGRALATMFTASASAAPHWLASLDTTLATWTSHHGTLAVTALAAIEYLVGIAAMSRRTRPWGVTVGLVLSIAIWVVGQGLGQLYSGQATDPNSAPLIALMAIALLALSGSSARQGSTPMPAPRTAGTREIQSPRGGQANPSHRRNPDRPVSEPAWPGSVAPERFEAAAHESDHVVDHRRRLL